MPKKKTAVSPEEIKAKMAIMEQQGGAMEIRLMIDRSQIGSILGVEGSHANRIRKESGAFISILWGRGQNRIVALTGSVDMLWRALDLVIELMLNTPPRHSPNAANLIQPCAVALLVHDFTVPFLTGSENEASFALTGASIEIGKDTLPNSTERMVVISAVDSQTVVKGSQWVVKKIKENPLESGTAEVHYDPSPKNTPVHNPTAPQSGVTLSARRGRYLSSFAEDFITEAMAGMDLATVGAHLTSALGPLSADKRRMRRVEREREMTRDVRDRYRPSSSSSPYLPPEYAAPDYPYHRSVSPHSSSQMFDRAPSPYVPPYPSSSSRHHHSNSYTSPRDYHPPPNRSSYDPYMEDREPYIPPSSYFPDRVPATNHFSPNSSTSSSRYHRTATASPYGSEIRSPSPPHSASSKFSPSAAPFVSSTSALATSNFHSSHSRETDERKREMHGDTRLAEDGLPLRFTPAHPHSRDRSQGDYPPLDSDHHPSQFGRSTFERTQLPPPDLSRSKKDDADRKLSQLNRLPRVSSAGSLSSLHSSTGSASASSSDTGSPARVAQLGPSPPNSATVLQPMDMRKPTEQRRPPRTGSAMSLSSFASTNSISDVSDLTDVEPPTTISPTVQLPKSEARPIEGRNGASNSIRANENKDVLPKRLPGLNALASSYSVTPQVAASLFSSSFPRGVDSTSSTPPHMPLRTSRIPTSLSSPSLSTLDHNDSALNDYTKNQQRSNNNTSFRLFTKSREMVETEENKQTPSISSRAPSSQPSHTSVTSSALGSENSSTTETGDKRGDYSSMLPAPATTSTGSLQHSRSERDVAGLDIISNRSGGGIDLGAMRHMEPRPRSQSENSDNYDYLEHMLTGEFREENIDRPVGREYEGPYQSERYPGDITAQQQRRYDALKRERRNPTATSQQRWQQSHHLYDNDELPTTQNSTRRVRDWVEDKSTKNGATSLDEADLTPLAYCLKVEIPEERLPALIGKRGALIQDICEQSMATITFDSEEERSAKARADRVRVCTITGSDIAIRTAVRLIRSRVNPQ